MSRIENSEMHSNLAENDINIELASKNKDDQTETVTISSDLLIEESQNEDPNIQRLLFKKNKNIFLTKIGVIAAAYFLICSLICFLLIFDMETAREYYWLYRLRKMTWVYVLLSVMLKLTFAFAGHLLGKFGLVFFFMDIYFSFQNILGLYFYFNVYLQTMYIHDGHYVIVSVFILFANSVAFIVSTLKTDRTYIYNYIFGFALMEVSTLIVMFLFFTKYHIMTMGATRYYGIFIAFTIINAYVAINAHYIVNYRGKKFYENEYMFAYFCFWTDWFSSIWIDILDKNKGHRRKTMMEGSHIDYQESSEDIDSVEVESKVDEESRNNIENNENRNNLEGNENRIAVND